jgi:hypothetical protein
MHTNVQQNNQKNDITKSLNIKKIEATCMLSKVKCEKKEYFAYFSVKAYSKNKSQ